MSLRPHSHTAPSTALDSRAKGNAPLVLRMADAFAFSSGLAAVLGAALSLVASLALGAPSPGRWMFLTASGTFIIYNLDRLRDLERDEAISPMRSAFISRHRRLLYGGVTMSAVGFALALLEASPAIIVLCVGIGIVGLCHRRMKSIPAGKVAYVSLSWVAACVGMPWIESGGGILAPWVSGIFLASLAANVIASNLRDDEIMNIPGGRPSILWIALGFVVVSIGFAIVGPRELAGLAWIPACQGLALASFRPTERYGHLAVDGALLVGALAASTHLEWLA